MRFDGEARRIDAGEREWDVAVAGIDAGATGGPVTVECRPVKPSNERVQRRRYLQQAVAPGAEQPTRFQRLSHLIENAGVANQCSACATTSRSSWPLRRAGAPPGRRNAVRPPNRCPRQVARRWHRRPAPGGSDSSAEGWPDRSRRPDPAHCRSPRIDWRARQKRLRVGRAVTGVVIGAAGKQLNAVSGSGEAGFAGRHRHSHGCYTGV